MIDSCSFIKSTAVKITVFDFKMCGDEVKKLDVFFPFIELISINKYTCNTKLHLIEYTYINRLF